MPASCYVFLTVVQVPASYNSPFIECCFLRLQFGVHFRILSPATFFFPYCYSSIGLTTHIIIPLLIPVCLCVSLLVFLLCILFKLFY